MLDVAILSLFRVCPYYIKNPRERPRSFRYHAFSESCVTTTVPKVPLELSTLIFALTLTEALHERLHAAADRLAAETEQRKAVQLEI